MSAITPSCLLHAVGFTQTVCDCWDTKPDDLSTSDSGLYLDELLKMCNWEGLLYCDDETMWEVISRGRDEAIKRFKSKMKMKLMDGYENAYHQFVGKIGEAKGNAVMNFSTAFAGVALRCNPIKSGTLKITAIGGIFNTTGTKTIYIYNNIGELETTFDINTTANIYTNTVLATPVELPLYKAETEITHYYIFYADDAIKPLNNAINCQYCSFKPCWSLVNKCHDVKVTNDRYAWQKYVQVSGVNFDDVADLYDSTFGATNYLFGLTVDIDAYCSMDDLFCTDSMNYDAVPHATAMAEAIRYLWAEYCITNQVLSDKLTRANLINRETLMTYAQQWSVEAEKILDYIAENIDIERTSCLKCRDKYHASNTLLLS
jgi:hypothetical protein